MKKEWKRSICPYDCPTGCGFWVETDGIKISAIRADGDDPVNHGLICGKMRHYERDVNSPERILKPLKRVGKKGSGEFRIVSWEEAVEEIVHRWKRIAAAYGANAIAYCSYSGVMSAVQRNCAEAFFGCLGGRRLIKTLCCSAKEAGYEAVVGETGCLDPRELKDSDYFSIWGSQISNTRLQELPGLREARKKGRKAVTIQVCAEGLNSFCDEVILIRPGTDGALALAMMHILSRKGLLDMEFLQKYTEGWEDFARTLKSYTPQWAELECGVPAEIIERLTLEYGRAKAPAIILGSGNSRYRNGGMTVRLITILSVVTGAWKQPGGGLCGCSPSSDSYINSKCIRRPDLQKNTETAVNINQLGPALAADAADKIYSLYVCGGNPANSVSDQAAVYRGLKREDLFTVVHERWMTDTARYADLILPATFSVEQSDIYTSYGYCAWGIAWKLSEAPGECKSNWDVFCMLAKALKWNEPHFMQTQEELLYKVLAQLPETTRLNEEQKRRISEGGIVSMPFSDHLDIRTDSGKMKIVNMTCSEPMPRYLKLPEDGYPLRLISVPAKETLNSIFVNRPELAERRGSMKLIMHPADAAARGISAGDIVYAYNDLKQVAFEAFISEKIVRGAVAAAGLYSSRNTLNGYGVNALHHARLGDMGEATTMNDNTVEVKTIGK